MGNQETAGKPHRVLSKKMMLATASILVAIAVILSVMWLESDDDGLFSLSRVDGGVKCTILRDAPWHWKYMTVHIELQGYGSAWWDFYYTNLSTGSWIAEAGDIRLLGDTVLRLYIVEAKGDGTVGQGDFIVVSPLNSTEFLQNEVYRFALTYGSLAISGTEYWMNFWFEDGDLETGPMEMIHIPY